MNNVAIAFEIIDHNKPTPLVWTPYSGHSVFDMKMDFNRKVWWLNNSHNIPDHD